MRHKDARDLADFDVAAKNLMLGSFAASIGGSFS